MKLLLPLIAMTTLSAQAQDLKLPDPLATSDGTSITKSEEWEKTLRPQTLALFSEHIYGRAPVAKPEDFSASVTKEDTAALDGKATQRNLEISFSGPKGKKSFRPVLFVPNGSEKPVAVFVLICHRSADLMDPAEPNPLWPVREIIDRGYATVAFDAGEIDPDKVDGYAEGVRAMFDPENPAPDAWGTIAAWAWGASRVADYLVTDKSIDPERIAVIGHSRGGKAALWAGAADTRFALTISNNSGCSGAALARRKEGERVSDINKRFPHWFCENYNQYNDREEDLPVDQHQLIGLLAPRLAYVASASDDAWADPEGEFLACVNARPVYALYGSPGFTTESMPAVNTPLHEGKIGYHLRKGKHDLNPTDWGYYMTFADRHWTK